VKKKKPFLTQIGCLAVPIIGLPVFCLALSIFMLAAVFIPGRAFNKTAVSTQAVITEIEINSTSSGRGFRRVYTVHVAFFTQNGEAAAASINEWNAAMQEGKIITILYDPANPQRIQFPSSSTVVGIFVIMLGLAGLTGTAAIIKHIFITPRKEQKKQP